MVPVSTGYFVPASQSWARIAHMRTLEPHGPVFFACSSSLILVSSVGSGVKTERSAPVMMAPVLRFRAHTTNLTIETTNPTATPVINKIAPRLTLSSTFSPLSKTG
jgi:hypothetical protein